MGERFDKWKKDFLKRIDIADPTKFNRKIYEKFFEGVTEEDFIKMLKNPDFKLTLHMEEFDHEIMFRNLRDACKASGAVYQERVYDPRIKKVTHNEFPGAPMIYNMLHQRSESESYVASDTTSRNAVGQVTGESKGAQFSKPELAATISTNRFEETKEMMMVRAGGEEMKQQVYNQILNEGTATMSDKEIDLNSRKEVNKLKVNYLITNLKLVE